MSLGSSHLAKRRELRVAIVALAVAVAVLAVCATVYLAGRSASRDRELRHLACSLVQYTRPGTEPGDSIRARYDCPPYQVTAPRDEPSTSSPSPSASRKRATPHASASRAAQNRPAPGPSRTLRPEPAPARVSTATITHRASQPRVTVTRTRTASTLPLAPLGPLPGACQLVGDLVCRN